MEQDLHFTVDVSSMVNTLLVKPFKASVGERQAILVRMEHAGHIHERVECNWHVLGVVCVHIFNQTRKSKGCRVMYSLEITFYTLLELQCM